MDDFDFEYEDAAFMEEAYKRSSRGDDKRICACGHGMTRHHVTDAGLHYCKPSAYACPCKIPTPVMLVPTAKYFMKKSHGSGTKHALSMGYIASKKVLGEEFTNHVEWLIDKTCPRCKTEFEGYYPTRITLEGQVLRDSDIDRGVTAFLCPDCRDPEKYGIF